MLPPQVIPHRLEIAGAHKERGGQIAAVLPIHYPRALLRAFGILPIEVWGPPAVNPGLGAAHLQPYVCSIVRNALSFLQSEEADVADLILVPHACDSLQGLGSILIDFVRPRQPILPFYLPRARGEAAVAYLTGEIQALCRRLEQIVGHTPSEAAIMEAVEREEAADELLSQLHARRSEIDVSDFEFYRLVRSREYVPAQAFAAIARSALETRAAGARSGVPIIFSGIVPEPMKILEALSEMGGRVVGDDLACCGRRLYSRGTNLDPFRRMAEGLLTGPPDPTRGSPISERLLHLVNMVRATHARGVVFYAVKFCEPELFDHPRLRGGLQKADIPSVVIEADIGEMLPGHTWTRIEAFLERLA